MRSRCCCLHPCSVRSAGGAGMSDLDLLKLAAKAAGYEVFESGWMDAKLCLKTGEPDEDGDVPPHVLWNPLTDDGDALRLAVKLDIQVWRRSGGRVEGIHSRSVLTNPQAESLAPCPYAATRRTIVRAAAEIGKAMP